MKAGLFGRPLSKSLSQAVFGAFSRILGSPISYELRECGADELADDGGSDCVCYSYAKPRKERGQSRRQANIRKYLP